MHKNNHSASQAHVSVQQFKDVMGHFATGITLVTTINQEGAPAGLIVNSLSSVSLDPPLILFCLGKKSQLHSVFAKADVFSVNILNTDQLWLAKQFTAPVPDRWADVDYVMDDKGGQGTGAPLIKDALAHIECQTVARHDAGDHTIYIGQAVHMTQGQGAPLLYHSRAFGEFTPLG